jgi:predicted nucleic acid-binding protein
MLVIPGIFKDNTFIPEKPLDLPDGIRGQFTVDERSINEAKLAESQRVAVEAFVAGIEAIDLLQAAFCLHHDYTLVTHNTDHVSHLSKLALTDWVKE